MNYSDSCLEFVDCTQKLTTVLLQSDPTFKKPLFSQSSIGDASLVER